MTTRRRVPALESYSWQQPVKDIINNVPEHLSEGDRYIIGGSPSGPFEGKATKIAYFYNNTWHFDTPAAGWKCYILSIDKEYYFNGNAWEDSQYQHPKGFTSQPTNLPADHVIEKVNVNEHGHLTGTNTKLHPADTGMSFSVDHYEYISVAHGLIKNPAITLLDESGDIVQCTVKHSPGSVKVSWEEGWFKGTLLIN